MSSLLVLIGTSPDDQGFVDGVNEGLLELELSAKVFQLNDGISDDIEWFNLVVLNHEHIESMKQIDYLRQKSDVCLPITPTSLNKAIGKNTEILDLGNPVTMTGEMYPDQRFIDKSRGRRKVNVSYMLVRILVLYKSIPVPDAKRKEILSQMSKYYTGDND